MHGHAGHAHTHTDDSRRLTIALVLLLAFMAAEVVVGILASSLALLADAAHMLTDAGALANATLVLTSESDTLYRTTGENGTVSFTDVPPGTWMLAIRGDAPAYHRFDPDRVELELKPGETKALAFRLVPRKREVQIIGDGLELKSTTGDAKSQQTGSGVKVIRPNDNKQDKQDR